MNLPCRIRDQLSRLDAADGFVVAVSGGADSTALLRALCETRGGADGLMVAHVNHQLRGADSDADEEFVRQLCKTLAVPFQVNAVDVAAIAEDSGENLEAAARRLRYEWFSLVATKFGMPYVVTGHTADDQAETVLMRLLRGAGLQGLRGIAPSRRLCERVTLLRPMLHVTRADVRTYLNEIHQPFREDRSNIDVRFARNRVRHEVMPVLARQCPAIAERLVQIADQAADVFREIELHARALLVRAELPPAGFIRVFSTEALKSASSHLVCEMLRLLWSREGWGSSDMRRVDWNRAAAAARGDGPAVDLAGPIRVQVVGRVAQIGPAHGFST